MPLNRRQVMFLVRFGALLLLFYLLTALEVVDRLAIEPFTRGLVIVSSTVLNAIGERVETTGTIIRGHMLAVDVKNGCNGIEAMVFLGAAMLAFAASVRDRIIGLIATIAAVQLLNLVRIVTLYLIGVHRREWFDAFHLAVWQTIIFGAAVLTFLAWTRWVQQKPDAVAAG